MPAEMAERLEQHVENFVRAKKPGEVDTPELQQIKSAIRRTEARAARAYETIYFDYDKSNIRDDQKAGLTQNADKLKTIFRDYSTGTVTIEGHADERGTREYNIALSARSATATRESNIEESEPRSSGRAD